MKIFFRHLILFALPFFTWVLFLFLRPLDKKFAFHFVNEDCAGRSDWIYHQVFENPDPVDVAFIGSSRTWHAVMDSFVEVKWNQHSGDSLRFLNLGYCRFGRNIHYLLLKDLVEKKKVKTVVLEITPEEDHYSHIDFGYLADTKDLFLAPVLVNKDYFSDIFKGFISRFEQFRFQLFGKQSPLNGSFTSFGYAQSPVVIRLQDSLPHPGTSENMAHQKTGFNEYFYLHYPREYLQKISELMEENHARLLFLYIPSFTTSADMPFYKNYYGDRDKILFPPDSILSNQGYWIDEAHLNDRGARAVSEMIVVELSKMMKR